MSQAPLDLFGNFNRAIDATIKPVRDALRGDQVSATVPMSAFDYLPRLSDPGEHWALTDVSPKYAVSSYGRIASLHGQWPQLVKAGISTSTRYRYFNYRTDIIDGKRHARFCSVHRAVAVAFVSGRKEGFVVNHRDGDKLNNQADNLEWISSGDNVRHAFSTGLLRSAFGERAGKARLTELQVINILHCRGAISSARLAALYGVSKPTILSIWANRNWRHIARAA